MKLVVDACREEVANMQGHEDQEVFDDMPTKKPKLCSVGDASVADAATAPADRLSTLPDELLHHVLSFLRAWEVVRTCVLSRRWRHLWASAPCIDLRVWRLGGHHPAPEELSRFVYCFFLEREASAPLHTLRLLSSPLSDNFEEDYTTVDVGMWIQFAIKRQARVIHLTAHPQDEVFSNLERVNVSSCHLEHLKLSGCSLSEKKLRQLCSQCPSLEVLDLKGCNLDGSEISSSSLKRLSIIECWIMRDLTISAPNLLSLHCVKPHYRAPLFGNLGILATATVVLDDSFLNVGYKYEYKDIDLDALEEGSDNNSDSSLRDDPECDSDTCSEASTCEYSEILTGYEDERCGDDGEDHDHCKHCNCYNHGPYWSGPRYGRRNIFGAGQILGGHNVLCSLSNATSLELLANSREAILNRELKTCPVFHNLKTLSLGEWCMAADFDSLVSFLRHSPNLERLFLELKLLCVPRYQDGSCRKRMEDSTRPEGRSFACTHLKMVKIKCLKNDNRVHLLAQLFLDNGVPIENIYVCQRSTCHQTKPR